MRYSEDSARFPYTYACDWLRIGRGNPNMSRSDASLEIGILARHLGREKAEVAEEMAREYIDHFNTVEMAEEAASRQRAEWIERIDAAIAEPDQ